MSISVCKYPECQNNGTEHCDLCERNDKYRDLYDNGKNVECTSPICAHNKDNGKCSLKIGKGKVANCEEESMPF